MTKLSFLLAVIVLLGGCTKRFDLLIKSVIVYDGSGSAPIRASVAVSDDRIVKIGNLRNALGKETIEGQDLAIAPGFIDMHAHLEPLTLYPDAKSHVMQGVTTALGGPDGGSPLLIGNYLDTLEKIGTGLNVAYLIGHNTIRNHVIGPVNRSPDPEELAQMKKLVADGIDEGAFGMSTGLKYLPGTFAETPEIIALAKEASKKGGIYTSHLREEGLGLLESVEEAIEIARKAGITVVLTHHKAIGEPMWGASQQTLALVDKARNEGLDVRIDQYPYTASHTGISIMIPSWALTREDEIDFASRCQNRILRDSIKKGIIHNMIDDRGGNDLHRVQFSKIDWKPEFTGLTLHDLVVASNMEPTIENGAEMVIEIQLHRGANCIYHVIDSLDVVRIMQHPQTMIASDGRLSQPGKGHPHPRAYGTFPRVLGYYSRELGVLTMEEAIQKMTSMPADALGITDRGLIQKGAFADLVIFNPKTVKDQATFQDPHHYPRGIEYVIINGVMAVRKGRFLDTRNGKILRKPL